MRCAVLHCTNSTYNNPDGVSFHGFPTDVEVLHVWVAATGRSDFVPNISSKICGIHFDDDAYLAPKVLKKLKANAVPTIFSRTLGVNKILFHSDPVQQKRLKSKIKVSSTADLQSVTHSPLACILNSNTAINKVQLVQECTETVSECSTSPSVFSKVVNAVSSYSFNQTTSSEVTPLAVSSNSALSKYVPIKVIQMQNLPVVNQGFHLGHLMPPPLAVHGRHPPEKQLKCLESNIQSPSSSRNNSSKSGIVKVVDMKKLLEPPPSEMPTNTSNKPCKGQECNAQQQSATYTEKIPSKPHEKLKNVIHPHNKSSEIITHGSKKHILKSSSKVTVSHVFDCLRVILPGKFDLARLIPNEKVAALVIRYLKLVDNETSQNVVKTNLKIIIDAKKAQESKFNNDMKHPYLNITDKDLQEALAKVFPPHFSMIDVTNEILKCLCIILSLDVFIDGYHILRKKISRFLCEKQKLSKKHKLSEVIDQNMPTERITLQNKSSKEEKFAISKLHISNPPHTNRSNVTNKLNAVNSSVALVSQQKFSEKKFQNAIADKKNIDGDDIMESSDNDEVNLEDWYEKEKKKRKTDKLNISKKSNPPQDKGFDNTGKSNEVNSSVSSILKIKQENKPKYSLSNTNMKDENDSSTEESSDSEYVVNSGDESSDEDWYDSVKKEWCKGVKRKKELLNKPSVNLIEIIRYLEEKQCSAKDVLVNFRLMFYLCRFLHIKSQQANLQKLKTALHWIMKRDVNRKNVKYEDNLFQNKINVGGHNNVQYKDNLARHKVDLPKSSKNCNDKLKLKPIVILHNIADYKNEDMLFMKKQRRFQPNTSVQRFSSDQVRKLTNESYKVFRRIIMKRDGNKIVFRLKYEKLVPGSEVFVKDFRNPFLGWMRGIIKQESSPLRYMVKLTSGGTYWCGPEQIRPLSDKVLIHLEDNLNTRVPRLVKPKQLFDL